MQQLVTLSDNCFTHDELLVMESKVCQLLQYNVNRVTPYHFLSLFLRASNACKFDVCLYHNPELYHMVCYMLQLSRLSYYLSFSKPGLLTAASLYLERVTLGLRDPGSTSFWTEQLEVCSGYNIKDIQKTVEILHDYQYEATMDTSHTHALFIKFSSETFHMVSTRAVHRKDELGFGSNVRDGVTKDEVWQSDTLTES